MKYNFFVFDTLSPYTAKLRHNGNLKKKILIYIRYKELCGRDNSGHHIFGPVFAHHQRTQSAENLPQIYTIFEIRRADYSTRHAN